MWTWFILFCFPNKKGKGGIRKNKTRWVLNNSDYYDGNKKVESKNINCFILWQKNQQHIKKNKNRFSFIFEKFKFECDHICEVQSSLILPGWSHQHSSFSNNGFPQCYLTHWSLSMCSFPLLTAPPCSWSITSTKPALVSDGRRSYPLGRVIW